MKGTLVTVFIASLLATTLATPLPVEPAANMAAREGPNTDSMFQPAWISNSKRSDPGRDSLYEPSWSSGAKKREAAQGDELYTPTWQSGAKRNEVQH
ncbi:hypothetical protein DACRYDRAFT_24857 [Dacryopinax primogenitus]|uniref:Uncharacterized protein n=1 Tax=Dacryopinax primogenitus (strain DJM 731) TaxID=1858805 RepID=M5FWW3_DACPD|nr:uncharacterized protein DACRYDRAFT_24857 [Dacryopinax primogenitus]EJT97941.1 hypothetical protein DACRYDRAFT_24857 [Dacryopinax primogenitus]